jgi:hypothetical protein
LIKNISVPIKASDLCVISLIYQSKVDLNSFSIIINSVSKLNNNIITVSNNSNPAYNNQLEEIILKTYNYLVFIIKDYYTWLI